MKSPMLIFISTLTGYCHIQDVRPCLPPKEDELPAIAAHPPAPHSYLPPTYCEH